MVVPFGVVDQEVHPAAVHHDVAAVDGQGLDVDAVADHERVGGGGDGLIDGLGAGRRQGHGGRGQAEVHGHVGGVGQGDGQAVLRFGGLALAVVRDHERMAFGGDDGFREGEADGGVAADGGNGDGGVVLGGDVGDGAEPVADVGGRGGRQLDVVDAGAVELAARELRRSPGLDVAELAVDARLELEVIGAGRDRKEDGAVLGGRGRREGDADALAAAFGIGEFRKVGFREGTRGEGAGQVLGRGRKDELRGPGREVVEADLDHGREVVEGEGRAPGGPHRDDGLDEVVLIDGLGVERDGLGQGHRQFLAGQARDAGGGEGGERLLAGRQHGRAGILALSWPLSAGRMFQTSLAEPSALKTLMASPSVQTTLTSRTAARVRLPPSMVAVTLFWMFSGI